MVDLEFWKGGFQYAIKVCAVRACYREVWEHAPPPPKKIWIFDLKSFLAYSLGEIAKVGWPTTKPSCCTWSRQNQRRDSALCRRGCIAAGYLCKAWENKHSYTDSILPSLAAEGAMHEQKLYFISLTVSVVYTCMRRILDTENYWVGTRVLLLL